MYDDFTIITCSYNTPLVTECMLKSFYKYHSDVKHRIIVVENSTNDDTSDMLKRYNIPFVNGKKALPRPDNKDEWWYHHTGLDWAVNNCTTPYCLILDTDIIFRNNIKRLLSIFSQNKDYVAMGEHISGGNPQRITDGKVINVSDEYILPRIHPCFMLLDVEFFNNNKLTFSTPKNFKHNKNNTYDIGSFLLESIYKLGKKTIRVESNEPSYIHCGGLSWVTGAEYKMHIYKTSVAPDLGQVDITNKYFTDI